MHGIIMLIYLSIIKDEPEVKSYKQFDKFWWLLKDNHHELHESGGNGRKKEPSFNCLTAKDEISCPGNLTFS